MITASYLCVSASIFLTAEQICTLIEDCPGGEDEYRGFRGNASCKYTPIGIVISKYVDCSTWLPLVTDIPANLLQDVPNVLNTALNSSGEESNDGRAIATGVGWSLLLLLLVLLVCRQNTYGG